MNINSILIDYRLARVVAGRLGPAVLAADWGIGHVFTVESLSAFLHGKSPCPLFFIILSKFYNKVRNDAYIYLSISESRAWCVNTISSYHNCLSYFSSAIAQLVGPLTADPEIASSNPFPASIFMGIKIYLRLFFLFCWPKKGGCRLLAKVFAINTGKYINA